MPITVYPDTDHIGSLDEVHEYFDRIDIRDHEAIIEGAPVLRALSNNRTFLTDAIAKELLDISTLQTANLYGAQVFALGSGRDFYLRANFWPASTDTMYLASGPSAFFYGVPHDHNFDFLTVGYYGPGYLSDFYEYEMLPIGYRGEQLQLKFVGREALSEGKVMLYRQSIDIHDQLPPTSFSISLNVLANLQEDSVGVNQSMIDLSTSSISYLGNRTSLPLICEIAGHIGDDECAQLLLDLSRNHPNPRGRFSAAEAFVKIKPEQATRVWEVASDDPHPYVSVQARQRIEPLRRAFGEDA